jgi:predicted MFS family arabinose efflux permease
VAGLVASAAFSPLVFFGSSAIALVGMLLWGIGYATQDTLFKALIAGLLPEGKRNLAFGLFYAGYGVGWLAGSVVVGLLYEHSLAAVVVFSVVAQLASVPLFVAAGRYRPGNERWA